MLTPYVYLYTFGAVYLSRSPSDLTDVFVAPILANLLRFQAVSSALRIQTVLPW